MKRRISVMAWRNLWRQKRRTGITLSSIVFGTFLAIMMTGIQDAMWREMIDVAARLLPERDGGHQSRRLARLHAKVLGGDVEDLVAAALGLEHQNEGGIGLDVDSNDGVHHKGQAERP